MKVMNEIKAEVITFIASMMHVTVSGPNSSPTSTRGSASGLDAR